jgi:hypothetical protein
MTGVTAFGIFLTPVFHVLIGRLTGFRLPTGSDWTVAPAHCATRIGRDSLSGAELPEGRCSWPLQPQWWESELAGCTFADPRLGQRLRKLVERMGGAIGASLPLACQDWASTKAPYRFFSNDLKG